MKKFTKALAAIVLMMVVVVTTGCNKKPENPEQTVTLAGIWYANDQWIGNEHDRAAMDFVNSNTVIWYGTVSTNKNAFQNMEGTALDGCAGWYYFSKTYYTYVLTDNKIFFNDRIFTIFEDYLVEDGSSSQWKPWDNGNGGGGAHATVTVTTYNPTDITSTEATCCADVTAENGSNIRELGICWGTSAYPTIENRHLSTTTWNSPFICTISDLTPETRYHVRAYALDGTSYVYGDDKSFTTLPEGGGGGQTYTITATANPANGGMVIGSGIYQEGQQCTLIATVNSGYDFVNWTENGTEVSLDLNYTFAVNANRNLVANFIQQASQYYTINVSANPSIGGMVSGGGTYQQGQTCTVNAIANAGFSFIKWTENGSPCSMYESYAFIVTGDRDLVAVFSGESHAPEGAINGKFTINPSGYQVYFSQGNLQYIGSASPAYWKFAENQYDYLGTTTGQNSDSRYVDRDLFGWGTSGYHDNSDRYNVNYQPYSTSVSKVNETYNYYGYGPSTNMSNPNIAESNYDWGVYNPISNGGNVANMWRTLTIEEWQFVFEGRDNYSSSGIFYAKAQITGLGDAINGVILLPDNWNASYYSLKEPNTADASYSSNIISASQWASLEQYGAVFLPVAGCRFQTSVYLTDAICHSVYWSASSGVSTDGYNAYGVHLENYSFSITNLIMGGATRSWGQSVRLVCPAE